MQKTAIQSEYPINMNKTKIITFRTTKNQKDEIVRYAKLKGISAGQLLRNWIDVFLNVQVINSTTHAYQLRDGRIFPNMKALCDELIISSHTARKRIKNGKIKKIAIDPTHAKQYGDEEIHTARSRETEKDRIQV